MLTLGSMPGLRHMASHENSQQLGKKEIIIPIYWGENEFICSILDINFNNENEH